jgi:hypothetical protein
MPVTVKEGRYHRVSDVSVTLLDWATMLLPIGSSGIVTLFNNILRVERITHETSKFIYF